MFSDRRVKAGFATGNGKQVDASFELASQIAVYEIGATEAQDLGSISFRTAAQGPLTSTEAHGRNGRRGEGCGGGKGKGGGCGGAGKGKRAGGCGQDTKLEDLVDRQEIVEKVASLDGVSVLFVNRTLNANSVLELSRARIFTVKVDSPKEIAEVIARLQEMLVGNPPLWLRRHLVGGNTECEE